MSGRVERFGRGRRRSRMDAGRRADRHVLAAVAAVAVATGAVAVVAPAWMRARWSRPETDEPERLYQAWGISTVGLGATVAACRPPQQRQQSPLSRFHGTSHGAAPQAGRPQSSTPQSDSRSSPQTIIMSTSSQ